MEIDFKAADFEDLCGRVSSCTSCPRMNDSLRVLNRSVGSLSARIMFIGEAPGRHGADTFGIPFHGDQAGHNFEGLLRFAGISRNEIYVTNAALCNPKDEKGNNSTPNKLELSNCSKFLKEQIELISPKIIVTLGAKALEALEMIEPHGLELKRNVRTISSWRNIDIIPIYHPGQRALLHRSLANQRSDYQFISEKLRHLTKRRIGNNKTYGGTNTDIGAIVEYMLLKKGTLSYFSLHKLFYLIEYNSLLKLGNRSTDAYFIRQKDGPYCTDLHIQKLKKTIKDLTIKVSKNGTIKLSKNSLSLFGESLLNEHEIDEELRVVIDFVLDKYGAYGMAKLKNSVYLSRPMRNILLMEKERNMNLYNSPIPFEIDRIHANQITH